MKLHNTRVLLIVSALAICGSIPALGSPVPGSKDSLKYLPDGAQVSFNGAIVTAAFDFDGEEYDFCYVERTDRSFGIWVSAPAGVYHGDLVDVSGVMATGGGERAILADSVDLLDMGYPYPAEMGMPNKVLGGGAVGSYTPAIADGAGLNNTGILAKVWGKVTAKNAYGTVYYLDDGSGVEADDGNVGVKVYDLYEVFPPPDVGDYHTAVGVSSSEIPDGNTASIRTLWVPDILLPPMLGPGQGTVSGTVTASGADGLTVKIYSTSDSTTATFVGDTASYSNLTLPEGDNAVTASVIGYKTTTQLVWVDNGDDTVANFTLIPIPRIIDMVASPPRVPPDWASEITVTAIVRDEEGRRFGNEAITWDIDFDPARVVSADAATDAVGEARLVVRAPDYASTATVTATCGGASGRCFPEFAAADAPTILVLEPRRGDTVSGYVDIVLRAVDPSGSDPELSQISLIIDGQEVSASPGTPMEATWNTFGTSNQLRTIAALAMDSDGNVGYSNVVKVTPGNQISELLVSPQTVGASESVEISARLEVATDWRVTITDTDDNEVWAATGNGPVASATWPGTTSGGLYKAWVSATPGTGGARSDDDPYEPIAVNTTATPQVLLVAAEQVFRHEFDLLKELVAISKREGLTTCVLLPADAKWVNMRPMLSNPACRYLYISSYGRSRTGPGDITRLYLSADRYVLYARQWVGAPPAGDPDPYNPGWKVAYAKEELSRSGSPFKLAWLHAGFSGRIGAYRPVTGDPGWDDYYYGKYGILSCYETTGGSWNDMAEALGITEAATYSWPCGYVGLYSVGSESDTYIGTAGLVGMIARAWDTLAYGYTFEFTRDWLDKSPWWEDYQAPKPDSPTLTDPYMDVAPYFNWRFWGTPSVSLF